MKISSSHRVKTFVVLQLCTPSNFPHIELAEVAVTNQRASFTTSDQSEASNNLKLEGEFSLAA